MQNITGCIVFPATITEDTLFYCHMEKRDIYKAGACKFKNAEEKNFSLGCLFKAGLFDITNNKYRSWFIKFVDISNDPDDVLDYITDYAHLNMHYDKLMGVPMVRYVVVFSNRIKTGLQYIVTNIEDILKSIVT